MTLRKSWLGRTQGTLWLVAGISLWLMSVVLYAFSGYHRVLLFYFIAALVLICLYLKKHNTTKKVPHLLGRTDLWCILGLLAVFSPIYLSRLYDIPFQMNTDEIGIMLASQKAAVGHLDPFGVSHTFFGLPSLVFWLFGRLAESLGGVTLFNIRLIHATSGLLILVGSYLFFRQLKPPLFSVLAAAVLGGNHALIMISRMAMRDNTALLIEVAALAALSLGFFSRSRLMSFLGGMLAGLSFYGYFPGRITILLWFLFLSAVVLFFGPHRVPSVVKLGALALAGFLAVATPMFIVTMKDPRSATSHARNQLLLFPEGRDVQRQWVSARSINEGVWDNIKNGLASFNSKESDRGNIYPNSGHGFLDPLSGVLLWIGALAVVANLLRRRPGSEGELLIVSSFVFVWLLLSFVVNKSPSYTRLLVALPFTSFLVVTGLVWLGDMLGKLWRGARYLAQRSIVPVGVASIVLLNGTIVSDFIVKGLVEGHSIGGTARYVETRNDISTYSFFLAADSSHPYYDWGQPSFWRDWFGFFAGPTQRVAVISPADVPGSLGNPPFSLFLARTVWEERAEALLRQYPNLSVHPITRDGRLLAIEIL